MSYHFNTAEIVVDVVIRKQLQIMQKTHTCRQRGLIDADMVEIALAEIERGGPEGFSLRSAARAIGCDVATLSYHFGSKVGLERAVADRLHGEVEAPKRHEKWQERLIGLATAYHKLAQRYPNAFPLLLRFWTSGPHDRRIAEEWHQALFDAGLREAEIPALGCATYAAILGICAGEIGGVFRMPHTTIVAEIAEQDDLPLTKKLRPIFDRLKDNDVFNAAIAHLVAGIEAIIAKRRQRRLQV